MFNQYLIDQMLHRSRLAQLEPKENYEGSFLRANATGPAIDMATAGRVIFIL